MKAFSLFFFLPTLAFAQTAFTPEERDRAAETWRRAPVEKFLPKEAAKEGEWVARGTVEGSTLLWTLKRGAALDAAATAWIDARVAYDWAFARSEAATKNGRFAEPLPADPGPAPESLAGFALPDRFARAVRPTEHVIRFADVEYRLTDNIPFKDPKYIYFRNPNGVRRFGSPVAKRSEEELRAAAQLAGLSDSALRVMRSVSGLEGGFDAVNTYDTGFVSVGFIQFACLAAGKGSLAAVLADMREIAPEAYRRDFLDFGIGLAPDGSLAALDPETGVEGVGPAAAATIGRHPRLAAVFCRAGEKSPGFVAAQLRTAYRMYYPENETVSLDAGGLSVKFRLGEVIRSEAGMATMMDRKVQTGKLGNLATVVASVMREYGVTTFEGLAPYEREIVRRMKHRKDFLADTTLGQPAEISGGRLASRRVANKRGRRSS